MAYVPNVAHDIFISYAHLTISRRAGGPAVDGSTRSLNR
jgi:hypothetical protein